MGKGVDMVSPGDVAWVVLQKKVNPDASVSLRLGGVQTENKLKRCVKHIKDKRISYLYPSPPTLTTAKAVPQH
jgi:hypothetical protein